MKVPKYQFSTVFKRLASDVLIVLLAVLMVAPYQSFHGDLVRAEEFVAPEVTEDVVEEVATVSVDSFAEVKVAHHDLPTTYPYQRTFVISAYYSPLPCQARYATGNYESDKRLNGNGVAGADGTPVYPGMIAAPKSYAFGTKMTIPGMGVGGVHDRGGAIVSHGGAGGYDRLDVWMGYGDDGLTRALNWGKRTVTVTVHGNDPSIGEYMTLPGYNAGESTSNCGDVREPAPTETVVEVAPEVVEPVVIEPVVDVAPVVDAVPVVEVAPVVEPEIVEEPEVEEVVPDVIEVEVSEELDADLSLGDSGDEVVELQSELISLNFLRGVPSGVYDDVTEHAVFKFQQSQGLVGDKSSPGAGIFGPKTRSHMNNFVAVRNDTKVQIARATYPGVPLKTGTAIYMTSELDFGASGNEVVLLQEFLKEKGFFSDAATGFFGPVTESAVLAFQIEYGIVTGAGDLGAGRVGPSTLKMINSLN